MRIAQEVASTVISVHNTLEKRKSTDAKSAVTEINNRRQMGNACEFSFCLSEYPVISGNAYVSATLSTN